MTSFGDADDDTEIVFSNDNKEDNDDEQEHLNKKDKDNNQGQLRMNSSSKDNNGNNGNTNSENNNDKNSNNLSNNNDANNNTNNNGTGSSSPPGSDENGDGRPKLFLKTSAEPEIKYADDGNKPKFNIDASSDLDSDNEDTNKMTPLGNGSPNLTPHGMHTPQSRDGNKSGNSSSRGGGTSKPMLKPSASQQASDAREVSSSSPRRRPELNPATTSSKKPQLDVHDIRHFARNSDVADDYAYLATEMEPNNDNFENNVLEDDPPNVSEQKSNGDIVTQKERLNSDSKFGGSSKNDPKLALIEKLRNDKSIGQPLCVVDNWLYVGDCMNAAHITQIKNLGITHILNVSDKVPCYFLNNEEINYQIDYARIPIPNLEYSLIYDYFKAATQFIDIVNPDEDTIQLEKDISRHDRRDAAYDFGDDEMVVLSGNSTGPNSTSAGGGGSSGGNSTGAAGGGGSANGLDVLQEGKEVDQDHSNLDDANDMEFAFDSENDFDTNENSIKKKDSSHGGGGVAGAGNTKHAMGNSIELGQNVDNRVDNLDKVNKNLDQVNAKKSKKNKNKQQQKPSNNIKHQSENSDGETNLINNNNDNNNNNNDYRNRYKNMKRKILIHSGNGSSRGVTVVIAYLVARQIRFNNEEKKILNNIRIELFKRMTKYGDRIRDKRTMESQNRYINDLVYELDRRELHLMFYYNEKTMKQLKKMLKKHEKQMAQQIEELKQNNLNPNGKQSLRLVTQTSTYTDYLRIQQLKHQTDIYTMGYVGGMSLAVAYKYVLSLFEKKYGVGYYNNNNNNNNNSNDRKNSNNNNSSSSSENANVITNGIGDALDEDSSIKYDRPKSGFIMQLSIWEKKKRHGMNTENELPAVTSIRSAIYWVKEKDRSNHKDPLGDMYGHEQEVDEGPIPPEPNTGCCTIL